MTIALVVLSGCTGEEPQEIDLNATVPPTSSVENDDPNAAERARLLDLATQQCIDDPTREVGTVRIVDPTTNEVVSELTIECDTVRGG